MPDRFKRTALTREPRAQNRYGGVAKLAAHISGRSIWTVYEVLKGRGTSAPVSRAIAEARAQLAARRKPRQKGAVA